MTQNINLDFIKEHNLKECLQAFHAAEGDTETQKKDYLNPIFEQLARKILYGGYLLVDDDYEIYIRTVEFYYHEEEEKGGILRDPMVYHRNGKFPERAVPPFPLMTLHAHWSGFDITFEDPNREYRASALIREFAVFDRHHKNKGSWVYWNTTGGPEKSEYQGFSMPQYDGRSTYLQFYLNGFNIDGSKNRVEWKDFKTPIYGIPSSNTRKHVFLDEQKTIPDDRPWSFRRNDRIYDLREVSE